MCSSEQRTWAFKPRKTQGLTWAQFQYSRRSMRGCLVLVLPWYRKAHTARASRGIRGCSAQSGQVYGAFFLHSPGRIRRKGFIGPCGAETGCEQVRSCCMWQGKQGRQGLQCPVRPGVWRLLPACNAKSGLAVPSRTALVQERAHNLGQQEHQGLQCPFRPCAGRLLPACTRPGEGGSLQVSEPCGLRCPDQGWRR